MSVRFRLILLIGTVLFASMVLGGMVAGYQVRLALGKELAAGLSGARQTAASAFEDLPNSDHPMRDLRQLVATFDGNRHIRASLIDDHHRVLMSSQTLGNEEPAPAWFRHLIDVPLAAQILPVPMFNTGYMANVRNMSLMLAPTGALDVGSAWQEFRALAMMLIATSVAGLVLVWFVVGSALHPLMIVRDHFQQIGAGDYSGRLEESGSAELMPLQKGFNRMAARLEVMTARNRQLVAQLARLQEEERLDIARDLHDEIGPYLFAVNLDAEMIMQLVEAQNHQEISVRVREIQGSVGHMQRQVRELLGRLRPAQATEFGLAGAVNELTAFWLARHSDVTFDVAIDDFGLSYSLAEVVWRIVQEAVNNALRHARPDLIRIDISQQGGLVLVSVENNSVGAALINAPGRGGGLGLLGMSERVAAEGGDLVYGCVDEVRWRVAARLPLSPREGAQA